MKIGTLRAKNIRKNFPNLQVGGFANVPSTPPIIFLHTEQFVQKQLGRAVSTYS